MMKNDSRHPLTDIVKLGEGKDYSDVRTPTVPIFQSTNYLYDNVEEGTDILLSKKPGHIYARYTNPTVDTLNEIMAGLEKTEAALAFASGMAAISSTILAFCQPGDHIVSSAYIYGGTFTFFQNQLARFKIEVTFVDPRDHDAIKQSIKENTKVLYTEPLANPTLIASDMNYWHELAREHNCKLIVDNTFTPPPLCYPVDFGVDVSIHSATKYLGGHSDLLGGIICASQQDIEIIRPVVKTFGPSLAPMIAWLLIRGIRTLGIRVERQCENALQLAKFLENHPNVTRVFYPGLKSNEQHSLCSSQFSGFSGMLSFEVKGGWAGAKKVMENLNTILFTVSLGDISSLVSHPASTSHVYLSQDERDKIGVTDGLLRLSVGIEYIDDLKSDLEKALDKI
jgi:methionine-gamma-lyase